MNREEPTDDPLAEPHAAEVAREEGENEPEAPPQVEKLGWVGRFRRMLVVLVCVPAILVLGVILVSQTEWGTAKARGLAIDALKSELGLDASLDDVRVRWRYFPPSLTVVAEGIDIDHPVEGDLLEARALTIIPSIGALLSGTLDLQAIEIDEPKIHLIFREGQVVNFPELPESSDGPVEFPFRVLAVHGGAVDVQSDGPYRGHLGGLELVLEGSGETLDVELRGSEGELEHLTGREVLQELVFVGALDLSEGIEIAEARIRTPEASLELSDVEASLPFDAEAWRGGVAAELDLAHLAELPFGIDLPLEGHASVRGTLEGALLEGDPSEDPLGGIRATGELDIRIVEGRIDHAWGLGDELRLLVEVAPEELTLAEGSGSDVTDDGGRLALTGTIGLSLAEGFPVDVHADVDFQFANVIEQLGVTPDTPVWWPMRGEGDMRGTLFPLALDGPIALNNPSFLVTVDAHHVRPRERVISTGRHRVHGRWGIDDESFYFRRLLLETAGSRVQVPSIHLGFDNSFHAEAHGEVDAADIAPLTTFQLAGRGAMTVSITGDFDEPIVGGTADLRGFAFDTYDMGDVQTEWSLVNDYYAVSMPVVVAEKNTSRYQVQNLLVDFTEHVEVTGTLRARRLTLADAYDAFHLTDDERVNGFQATARGQMGFRFTHGFPTDGPNGTLDSGIDLEILDADLSGYAFDRGRLQAHWRWHDFTEGVDGGTLALRHFTLRKGGGTVNIDGDVDRGNVRLSVSADQIGIQQTEGIGESLPQLEGSYSVIGTVRGTTSIPHMHLDLETTGMRWDGALLGDARMYVRLTDRSDPWVREAAAWASVPEDAPCGHARYGLAHGRWAPAPPLQTPDGPVPALDTPMAFLVCGEGLGGQVTADMAVGWTDVSPVRGRIELRDYRLDPFLAQMLGSDRVHGGINGSLVLTGGALQQDGSLEGRAEFDRVEVSTVDGSGETSVGVRNEGLVQLDIERGGARFRRARFIGDGSRFEVRGGVDARGILDTRLDGRVDLAILGTLAREVEDSSGRLRFQVALQGSTADPTVHGDAEVVDGTLRIAGMPAAIGGLNGRVRFSERRVNFEDFEGDVAGGQLALVGSANLRDGSLERYSFDVAVRGATLVPDEDIELGVSSDMRLAWNQGDRLPRLSGQVDVQRARYHRAVQLSPTLGELYRPRVAEVQRYDPEDDNVAFDIRIEDRRPARIVNNIMDVRIQIDDTERPFRIVGTDQRWGIVGTLGIPRGTVRFRSAEFEVTEGEIRFDDETRIDPQFDVIAMTQIRRQQTSSDLTAQQWRVRLRAHGNLDGFQLDATSTPALTQEDLMLLLTVGMTSAEAAQLQAGDVGGTALEALSAISGVNEEVVNALRVIDDFAITTRYSRNTGRPEPMLTVGKRISERVRLSASTGLSGQDRTFQTGLEWRVGDQTAVQMLYDNINRESASNFGNVGVDLRWRLEFE